VQRARALAVSKRSSKRSILSRCDSARSRDAPISTAGASPSAIAHKSVIFWRGQRCGARRALLAGGVVIAKGPTPKTRHGPVGHRLRVAARTERRRCRKRKQVRGEPRTCLVLICFEFLPPQGKQNFKSGPNGVVKRKLSWRLRGGSELGGAQMQRRHLPCWQQEPLRPYECNVEPSMS
jgi:hypothetical protein